MRHPPIQIGQRFGRLTVIEQMAERRNGKIVWHCLCDCGNETYVTTGNLNNDVVSCGCKHKQPEIKDISGKRYGKLVVIEKTDERRHGVVVWKCQCDCGKITKVTTGNLNNGHIRSCGCLRYDQDRSVDIKGERFGRLVALERTDQKYINCFLWKCRCDCGREVLIPTNRLRSGGAKSCGCVRKKGVPPRNYEGQRVGMLTVGERIGEESWSCICLCGNSRTLTASQIEQGYITDCGCTLPPRTADLRGQRFGKLVVTGLSTERRGTDLLWNCICDCGNTTLVRAYHLTRGAIKSCGCLSSENQDISGQRRGHLTALRRTEKRDEFGSYIYEWRCDCGRVFEQTVRGTASSTRNPMCPDCLRKHRQDRANELRERIERDPETGVDRKSLNNIIEGKLTARNSSGVRGVHWNRSKKKWEVSGRENGKPVYLGSYKSLEEAKAVRQEHVRRVYGGSDYSNSQGCPERCPHR